MTSLGPCDTLGLSVEVHNTGGRDGDEVVQLYTRQPEATVPVPNIRLVAFERVTIPAGKTAEVELTVAPDSHAAVLDNGFADVYNGRDAVVVEKGRLELFVGGRQPPKASSIGDQGWISVQVSSTATVASCSMDSSTRLKHDDVGHSVATEQRSYTVTAERTNFAQPVIATHLHMPNSSTGSHTVEGQLTFAAPLFGEGMLLQRGAGTRVWGTGATPGATVTVSLAAPGAAAAAANASTTAQAGGNWSVTLPAIAAAHSATLSATDSSTAHGSTVQLTVAVGDLILCGGQSNMGFGMCGSQSANQTPQQALDALPAGLRVFYWYGSGPGGGAGKKCKTSSGATSVTPAKTWFMANASTAGGFSAVCLLTVQRLHEASNGTVPVGAVESCVSGTSVQRWQPPGTDLHDSYNCTYRGHNVCGDLWTSGIAPLLPLTVSAVLWDQGEADAKRNNASWYRSHFPAMITGWRAGLKLPNVPFIYVGAQRMLSIYDVEQVVPAGFGPVLSIYLLTNC